LAHLACQACGPTHPSIKMIKNIYILIFKVKLYFKFQFSIVKKFF
jgi:hypothetical protein